MKKLVTIILVFLLMGCTTVKYVEVPSIQRDTVIQHNTLIERDTVFHSEKIIVTGDTVYITQFRYKEKKVYIEQTDTVIRTDSIPYPVPVVEEKEVIRYRTSGWGVLGWVLLIIGVAGFLYSKLKNVKNLMR